MEMVPIIPKAVSLILPHDKLYSKQITLHDLDCQLLATRQWFSLGTPPIKFTAMQ